MRDRRADGKLGVTKPPPLETPPLCVACPPSFRIRKMMLRPNSHPRPAQPDRAGQGASRGAGPGGRRGPLGQEQGRGPCPLAPVPLAREERPRPPRSAHLPPPTSLPRTPEGGSRRRFPPRARRTPPRDAWLGPGRGRRALHVRSRAPRSLPGLRCLPRPPRGGEGGGASGGQGGGVGGGRAGTPRSPGCPGPGAGRSG